METTRVISLKEFEIIDEKEMKRECAKRQIKVNVSKNKVVFVGNDYQIQKILIDFIY